MTSSSVADVERWGRGGASAFFFRVILELAKMSLQSVSEGAASTSCVPRVRYLPMHDTARISYRCTGHPSFTIPNTPLLSNTYFFFFNPHLAVSRNLQAHSTYT